MAMMTKQVRFVVPAAKVREILVEAMFGDNEDSLQGDITVLHNGNHLRGDFTLT